MKMNVHLALLLEVIKVPQEGTAAMGLSSMDYLTMPPSGPETDLSWTDDLPLCTETGTSNYAKSTGSYRRVNLWKQFTSLKYAF